MGNSFLGLRRSYLESGTVLHACYGNQKANWVYSFNEISAFRFASSEDPQAEMRQYVRGIGGLLDYCASHKSDLFITLKSYFTCQGNLGQMAKELHTRYNTVIYRLKRIAKLTGLTLSDDEARFKPQMALRLHSIYHSRI